MAVLLITLSTIFLTTSALNCDKSFNYYENYGLNGFDVTCNGIGKGYERILEDISIFNEISLTITNSTLIDIKANIFRNVKNIRNLYIINTTLSYPKKQSIFQHLHKLERLEIVNTHIDIDNSTFSGLDKLNVLYLNNNNITSIPKGVFTKLPLLQTLKIHNNDIKNIIDIPLCDLPLLKYISLYKNVITTVTSDYFSCQKPRKHYLDFNLNDKNLKIDINPKYNLSNNVNIDYTEIDLSYNKISDLGLSLEGLSKLKQLNLEGNVLTSIHRSMFKTLVNIELVNLSKNNIKSLDWVLSNKKRLKSIDLSRNRLDNVSLDNLASLSYLNLESNNISKVMLTNTPVLKYLVLRNNNLRDVLDFIKVIPHLQQLILADNQVVLSSYMFVSLSYLHVLDMSNNRLDSLPVNVFYNLTLLKSLDLSNNVINSFNNNVFNSLSDLEVLNISYNKLETVHYSLLKSLKNLHTIDLEGNRLNYIEYDAIIANLHSLSVINIRKNLLSCEILSKIISYLKLKSIKYSANSEQFDYETENVAGITCKNTNEMARQADKIVTDNDSSSSKNSYVLFNVGIAMLIVLIAVIIGILAFRIHVYLKRRKYRADEFELVN